MGGIYESLVGKSSAPTIAPPPPPPPVPTISDAAQRRAAEDAMGRKKGRRASMITGPEGVVQSASAGGKTLIGS